MKDFWLKNKLSIIIAGYALVFGAVVYFSILPLIFRMKSVSNQIQEKITDQKIEETRLNNLSQMEKDWQDFQAQKNSTDVVLSPGSEISFIESIDSIAQKSSNSIDLKIGDQVDPNEIAKIKAGAKKNKEQKGIMDDISYNNYFSMQINLRGSYQNLVNFIHMLENDHFYINIISIDSKKQIIEENSPINNSNIFSGNTEDKKNTKEIINSNINAIVYTQR